MRIVFMGTPDFAVPILKSLSKVHEILAVVTQPDRPKGRGRGMVFSAVKEYALTLNLPILQPEKIRDTELSGFGADIFVVVAYGQILPMKILRVPPLGCINIHASLLPKYRGAAPMQRAMLNGDTVTGVTIQFMDKGIDTGDIILKKTLSIEPTDRFADLHDKMSALSCECILEALELIGEGRAPREPQNHEEATYAPMLTKEDGLIDWSGPGCRIVNQVRALDPWPGAYTYWGNQMLKIWDCAVLDRTVDDCSVNDCSADAVPAGTVVESGKHLLVKTGDGALLVTELQKQGGKRMKAADFLRGSNIEVRMVLG